MNVFVALVAAKHFTENLTTNGLIGDKQLFSIDPICPRVVRCSVGRQGFGDQLEQYIYCVRRAIVLNGTVVLSPDAFGRKPLAGKMKHSGFHDYFESAKLLGVRFVPDLLGEMKDAGQRDDDDAPLPCNTSASVNMWGNGYWANHAPKAMLPIPASLRAAIRTADARANCKANYPRTASYPNVTTVLIHVRTGDVCLKCGDVNYIHRVLRSVRTRMSLLPSNYTEIVFESDDGLKLLRKAFPRAQFRQSSLVQTICSFLGADVLVATGSSLPTSVAQFALPGQPMVFEEVPKTMLTIREKNVSFYRWYDIKRTPQKYTSPVYHLHDSIHMIDGTVI